ncbi:MAG: pseudouridine synthase [Bacteroidia bacterium]
MHRYFIIHKPYGMLSQFSKDGNNATLSDLFNFPKDVYPVGRLDSDSEGLLILTNDKNLNYKLLQPKFKHRRTYWVQVDGAINNEALEKLQKGVIIKINGKDYKTLPSEVRILENPINIDERNPPIRFRKNIPTSWIELTLTEGKNRQVRKMTAAVGFPTLRLIRVKIKQLELFPMRSGEVKEISRNEIYRLLGLL